MKLHEAISKVAWEEIECSFIAQSIDPEEFLPLYKIVFGHLLALLPASSKMTIHIDEDEYCYNDMPEVYGTDGETYNESMQRDERFALEFTKWEEWLGMEIAKDTQETFFLPDIVANCLNEMTMCGWCQQDIQAESEKLKKRLDNIDTNDAIPHDEAMIRINDSIAKLKGKRETGNRN